MMSQSLLSASRSLGSLTSHKKANRNSDQAVDAWSDLSLRWAHMPEGTFSHLHHFLSLQVLYLYMNDTDNTSSS